MLHFLRIRHLSWALSLFPLAGWAQPASHPPARAAGLPQAVSEALNAELFYEVLLGELSTGAGDPGTGYALMLEAARRSNDSALYRRAVEIALQARSGDSALAAVRTWKNAQPQSRDANRFQLQILVALNRTGDTAEPLRQELAQTPTPSKAAALQSIPQFYARTSDKALAASVVEQALQDELNDPALSSIAWSTVGRMRLAANDPTGALAAAQKAQALSPSADNLALLALELVAEGVS
ncbi:MAG: hypothetical protein J0H52_07660, partial [Comamonadaceae bacterium]|nr:hypothetical protein [Comamonadaceae bacterium]